MKLTRRAATLGMAAGTGLIASGAGFARRDDDTRWSNAPDLPFPVQEIYPALLDGTIYVIGGFATGISDRPLDISDRVLALTPGADESWREMPRLPIPTHHPQCVGVDGTLYAIGGYTTEQGGVWSNTNRVWTLRPGEDTAWQEGPPLPGPWSENVAVALDGRIHVITGRRPSGVENSEWNHQSDVTAHLVLDPAEGTWTTLAPSPSARNSAAAAVMNGLIHVVAGRTVSGGNTPAHEVYDPASNSWTLAAPLPQPSRGPRGSGGLAAASVGDTLYVFGGEWFEDGGGVYEEVWAWRAETDSWQAVSTMPTPRHGLGAHALDGAIYTIGGAAQRGAADTSAKVEVFRPE
ncbi:Kelch repeat-containing protein [Glycocaulis sp.]|uniref:Kelch repeat-containing protein n=1 Tax=Glycocaulis sp. TaxID=1969725 RepID=UPI003F725B3B